jgi:glycosyltransferase involved in cell wall biosynthesis
MQETYVERDGAVGGLTEAERASKEWMPYKTLFVQCFATPGGIAPRERAFARMLASLGHSVTMYGMSKRGESDDGTGEEDDVNVHIFQVDDCSLDQAYLSSTALLDAVHQLRPEVVIFKSIGYRIIDDVKEAASNAIFGTILGGGLKSAQINYMDFFLTEYQAQIEFLKNRSLLRSPFLSVMPKLVIWPVVEANSGGPREFDVCVVGAFIPRKNLAALAPLFDDVSLAFIGEGPTLPEIKELAGERPNIHFLGRLPHEDVFGVMSRSKLLVHPSKWEGVPRVSAEAFACGTPMVALRATLGKAYAETPFVILVEDETEIRESVQSLLEDQSRLAELSRQAVEYARAVHGPQRMDEIARALDRFLATRLTSRA